MADVNDRALQPVLREMARADDDRVGMSAIAHMLTAAEAMGWYLVPIEPDPKRITLIANRLRSLVYGNNAAINCDDLAAAAWQTFVTGKWELDAAENRVRFTAAAPE